MQDKPWIRGSAAVLVGALLASPAFAATIFGTLTQKGKPVAKAQLSLSCPGLSAPAQTQTDARGAYHFSVSAKGGCKLSYQNGSSSAATDVIIDPNPTQYDFEVDTSSGAARLVRR
jgi:hypothetical protein